MLLTVSSQAARALPKRLLVPSRAYQPTASIKGTIRQLHLVRAIACLGVVLTHARFVLWSGGQAYLAHYPMGMWSWYEFPAFFFDLVTSMGPVRVYFFFILSGFFLQYSVRQRFSVVSFFHHRFLRLYPAYLIATLLAAAVFYVALTYINPALATGSGREFNALLHAASLSLSWAGLGRTLLFSSQQVAFAATPHFWSMQHEVVFCLLFPLYYRLSVRERAGVAGAVLLAGKLAGNLLLEAQVFFLIGMLFYDLFSRGYRFPWALPKWGYYSAFAGLYLAAYLVSKHSVVLACVPMLLLTTLLLDFFLTQSIQVPRICLFISKASYIIYLNHMWGLLLYYALLSRFAGTLVFYSRWPYYSGALAAILLSLPVYWLIDKPIGAHLALRKKRALLPLQYAEHLSTNLQEDAYSREQLSTAHQLQQSLALAS